MMTKRILIPLTLLFLLSVLFSACNTQPTASGNYAQIPAGKAYAEGKEIYFVHTEASDPQIAEKLTNMMKSPVLTVPSLANVPSESLAQVYVFENGVKGDGPLGYQPDVFNHPPSSQGYTPLREIILVKWVQDAKARELKSETEIKQAEANGELVLTPTNVVVNMPFVVWDGGKR
ncbi:MAG: hypothetical protein WHS45_08930 [Anaerolinea sp.]